MKYKSWDIKEISVEINEYTYIQKGLSLVDHFGCRLPLWHSTSMILDQIIYS